MLRQEIVSGGRIASRMKVPRALVSISIETGIHTGMCLVELQLNHVTKLTKVRTNGLQELLNLLSNILVILGLAPADQAEIQVHQNFLQRLNTNPLGVKMFIDWHAYSQLLLTRKCISSRSLCRMICFEVIAKLCSVR